VHLVDISKEEPLPPYIWKYECYAEQIVALFIKLGSGIVAEQLVLERTNVQLKLICPLKIQDEDLEELTEVTGMTFKACFPSSLM